MSRCSFVKPAVLLLLASSTALAQVSSGSVPQIRVEAKLVQANCTATQGKLNEPTTLNATDTSVLEDGHQQSLVAVRQGDELPLTLTLLLDLSGSTEKRWQILRVQTANFIRSAMHPGDRVAVLSFSDTIRVLADSDHYPSPQRLADLVESIPVEDGMEVYKRSGDAVHGTRMWDALRLATSATPMEGRKAILVLTDGVDSASAVEPEGVVKSAQTASIPIYAVLSPSPAWTAPPRMQRPGEGPRKLREAVEQTGGITFLGDEQSVSSRLDAFLQILRAQFVVEYTPSARSAKPKAYRLQVRSRDPHVTIHCAHDVIH